MAEVKWTPEQKEAITYRDENILLAAAAGAGKTTVLVERIIRRILDPEDPIGIDEILVLTFTDAAAAEMKHKIAAAIRRKLAEDRSNKHLQRQSLLVGSAMISTVHSFCMSVIRGNIHHTDLPAMFGIISEGENAVLFQQALDRTLERFYSRIDKDRSFHDLVAGYGGTKNDNRLRKMIRSLYHFSESMADPVQWLNRAVFSFGRAAQPDNLGILPLVRELFRQAEGQIRDIDLFYTVIVQKVEENLPADHKMHGFFEREWEQCAPLKSAVERCDYTAAYAAAQGWMFGDFPSSRGKNVPPEIKEAEQEIKPIREAAKSAMQELQKLFLIPPETAAEQLRGSYPVLRTLKNILLMCRRVHIRMKREKNTLDFSDLEHEAYKLLCGKGGQPSAAAALLSEKYREILVDEYQDTNKVQDEIFRLISRREKNIFMVGDLKQSIYKFRNASPELFRKKYTDYSRPDGNGHLIRLFHNFRSRENVIHSVNSIFHAVMSEQLGDVDYTQQEYLRFGADYYPKAEEESIFSTELLLTDMTKEKGEVLPESKEVYEARRVAERIRQITSDKTFLVTDKESGTLRPVQYRDIVLLLQTKTDFPIFEAELQRLGIPSYSEGGQPYLSSPEVLTTIAFLQILDNPRQDLPLLAVLRCPAFAFTPQELAEIRPQKRSGTFYEAMCAAAEAGNTRAADFLTRLNEARDEMPHLTVAAMIQIFYRRFGYYRLIGALPQAVTRQANLRLLYTRAAEFEREESRGGVSRFMAYISALRENKKDLSSARALGENDDVVNLMTIHKSKGLEFPVVIVAQLDKNFNTDDLKSPILWNDELGFGLDFVDTERRIKYPSLSRQVIAAAWMSEMRSERMRLLYVALTRAKEKLILSSLFHKTVKGTVSGMASVLYGPDALPLPACLKNMNQMSGWIFAALAPYPQAEALRDGWMIPVLPARTEMDLTVTARTWRELSPAIEQETQTSPQTWTEQPDGPAPLPDGELLAKLEYSYPYQALSEIPVKLSVSEIKRRQMPEEDYVPQLRAIVDRTLRKASEVSGADRGTITHFVLQHIREEETETAEQIRRQIDGMTESGMITRQQADAVDAEALFAFYQSAVGRRMKAAKHRKEYKFYMELPVAEVYPDSPAAQEEDKIMLQGVVDCFFEEEDGLVILDYKTDRVSAADAERAAERYREQLRYYAKGLETIHSKKVKEKFIYFLHCRKTVMIS